MTMREATPEEARLQAVWERAAAQARACGGDPEMVAQTMFAAGFKLWLEIAGPARMAYYLGRLAYECEQKAGGEQAVSDAVTGGDEDSGPTLN